MAGALFYSASCFRPVRAALLAGTALLAGATGAGAAGWTYNWTGLGNGVSFADVANWVAVSGGPAPPLAADTANVTSGTPTITSKGRNVTTLNLSGGQFLMRPNSAGDGSTFTAGTLNLSGTGTLDISAGTPTPSTLTAGTVNMTGGSALGPGTLVATQSISQSAGTITQLTINTPSYTLSGGSLTANVNISSAGVFKLSDTGVVEASAQLKAIPTATVEQSGGTMNGSLSGFTQYYHSGGLLAGSLSVASYQLTDSAATSSASSVITASNNFALKPTSGTATVNAKLTGAGRLVKSAAGTIVLTNANDFTGTVSLNAGTLELRNGSALADTSAITISQQAGVTLLVTNSETIGSLAGYGGVVIAEGQTLTTGDSTSTTYSGTMGGETGSLVKQGTGEFTLGGEVYLSDLSVMSGRLTIGTGVTTNTASFESAVVQMGSTLRVAPNATLVIRLPNNLTNYGTLINDGTIVDDLDNFDTFFNNHANDADVASNTGSITNTAPGVWTGDVKTNAGDISNEHGGIWNGDVKANGNSGDIINNYGAIWTGDIVTNDGEISNENGSTWNGDILANSVAPWYGTDDWIWNRQSTWKGSVKGNAGTIMNNGTWIGNVDANTGYVHNSGTGNTWTGDVRNSLYLNNFAGAIWIGDVYANALGAKIGMDGTWTGKVFGNAGIIDATELWTGNVVANNGVIWNHEGGTWNGAVESNAGTIDNNGTRTGTVTTTAIWNGAVLGNAGTIINDLNGTWTGAVSGNTGTITNNGIWTGNFTNAGTVNARNQIVGLFDNEGLLQLTGSLTGITSLTNTGTVDMRGHGAAQTLTVGSFTSETGSSFGVDVDSTGASDVLVATSVDLNGGMVRVAGLAANGVQDYLLHYTILTAPTITGTFDGVTTDLAFYDAHLGYADPDAVTVDLLRNDQGFGEVGTTANQKAVGEAAALLGSGNPIYDAVLWLDKDEVDHAFDALSGEAYNSFASFTTQDAGTIARLLTSHIDQAFDAIGGQQVGADSYAPSSPDGEAASGSGIWGDFYGAKGSVTGAGFASTESVSGGMVIGADGLLGDWRLGVVLQGGSSGAAAEALNSTADSIDYGAGIYGGTQWGDTRLSLGALMTRHDIQSTRIVTFPGFSETLSASYAATTSQAFATLSHEFDLGALSLTPFLGVAQVRTATDGFVETGGAAALTSAPNLIDATFTSLGLGLSHQYVLPDDMLLTANVRLGWRHGFGDAPSSIHTLSGGTAFSVLGAPLVSDMVLLSAGLNLDIDVTTTVDLTYDGEFAPGRQTHAIKAVWATRF